MAAQRIRAANASCLSRCKSEGMLIDLNEEFSETSLNSIKGEFFLLKIDPMTFNQDENAGKRMDYYVLQILQIIL